MKMIHFSLISVVVGVLLVVLAAIWPSTFRAMYWSDEKAEELTHARAKAHSLLHDRGDPEAPDRPDGVGRGSPEFIAADEDFRRRDADRQRAGFLRSATVAVLKWTGAVCTLLGGIGCFFARRRDSH